MKAIEKVINMEDLRRTFILAMTLIIAWDRPDRRTFDISTQSKDARVGHYGEGLIFVPTKYFHAAIKKALSNLGLYPEDWKGYRDAIGEFDWVLRNPGGTNSVRGESSAKNFYGTSTRCYRVDNTKLSMLMEMEGEVESEHWERATQQIKKIAEDHEKRFEGVE